MHFSGDSRPKWSSTAVGDRGWCNLSSKADKKATKQRPFKTLLQTSCSSAGRVLVPATMLVASKTCLEAPACNSRSYVCQLRKLQTEPKPKISLAHESCSDGPSSTPTQ